MGTLGSTAILTGPGSDYSSERNNGGMLDRLFSKKLQVSRPFEMTFLALHCTGG